MLQLNGITLGTGAVLQPIDERDYKFAEAIVGAFKVDFNQEFRLPEPPDENQGSSLSCVAQSTSYLHWQIRSGNFSRRDLYSDIALPGGGAYLRDGVKRLITFGQATRDEVSDPNPETEDKMLDKTGITRAEELSDRELSYFQITDGSIDGVAQAVRDYKGAIFGIYGNQAGFADLTNPTPPPNQAAMQWAHALYAMGYHMHNGKKCIIAKSSWCGATPGHHEHHINEDWFNTGMTFNGWCVIPNLNLPMTNSTLVKNGGEYGVYDPATSEDGLITLMRNRGLSVPLKADPSGKQVLDFAAVDGMVTYVLVPKQ